MSRGSRLTSLSSGVDAVELRLLAELAIDKVDLDDLQLRQVLVQTDYVLVDLTASLRDRRLLLGQGGQVVRR